jgi:hypothetical protein
MTRQQLVQLVALIGLALAGPARAGDLGTAAEARAMLDKAAAAVKADRAGALEKFAKGEGGFKDRDLYPFCGGPDGLFTAHPSLVGKSLRDLKDEAGKALGAEMYQVAQEGQVAEVSYLWPRPGTTEPVAKVSYVTKVGDQVCAVGYYKERQPPWRGGASPAWRPVGASAAAGIRVAGSPGPTGPPPPTGRRLRVERPARPGRPLPEV